MCISRKYPDPHHGGNRKFWRSGGLKGLRNSGGVRGLKTKIHFQRAHNTIVPRRLLWVVLVLSLVMLQIPTILQLKMTFPFLLKVVSKQTSLNEKQGIRLAAIPQLPVSTDYDKQERLPTLKFNFRCTVPQRNQNQWK